MEIRPYGGMDEAGLLDVWHAAMFRDRVGESLFRTKVLLDANFQPANLPVAVEDGRIVGFVLALTRQVPLFLQGLEPENAWITAFGVHPGYQRRGIGRALFEHVLDRLAAGGRKRVAIAPYVPNYFIPGVDVEAYPGALAFLQNALGFSDDYHAISMGIDLTDFRIPAEIIELERALEREGIVVRPVAPADLPGLMVFLSENFGWDWYRHAGDYLLEYYGDSPHQICFLVALHGDTVVGFCQQRRERFGPFGVRADYRRKGIGRLMLYKCLVSMSARQVYFSYFLWTGEDAARLYAQVGYRKRREFAVLSKML